MRQFLVRYDTKLVGVLYINEEGQYKYICNRDIIDEISPLEPIAPALATEQPEFSYLIPYFKVRLDTIEGPIKKREFGFLTDKVRLVEI